MILTIVYRHYDETGNADDRLARIEYPDNVDLNVYVGHDGEGNTMNFAINRKIEVTINSHEVIKQLNFQGYFTTQSSDIEALIHALQQCASLIQENAEIYVNDTVINEAYEKYMKSCGNGEH